MKKTVIAALVFTIFINGCSNAIDILPNLETNNQVIFSSEATAHCEKTIRSKLEKNEIRFVNVKHFSQEIENVNKVIGGEPLAVEYKIDEVDHQIQTIEKNRTFKFNSTKGITYTVSLGLNTKNASQPMYLKIESEGRENFQKSKLLQQFSVSPECDINLKTTSFTEIVLNGNVQTEKKKTLYGDELKDEEPISFAIPEGKESADFQKDFNIQHKSQIKAILNEIQNKKNLVGYAPFMGVFHYKIVDAEPLTEAVLGQNIILESKKIQLIGEKATIEIFLGFDFDKEIYLVTNSLEKHKKTWTLPERLKDQIFLGQPQLGSYYFDSKLPDVYLTTQNSYILKTNKASFYKNISGYYNIEKISQEGVNKTIKVTEKYPPTFVDTLSPDDLKTNDTIQSDLPEIVEIAGNILKQQSSRKEQIQEILKYLSKNYSYDYEMLNKDQIRPLTTQEALERKKGVCQHYAVLFTAIARALKIPTRIVVGWLVKGNSAGMHAWVEAEVDKNLWQVVEPQSETGLVSTRTRHYFPLTRGETLEDQKVSSYNYIQTILNTQFTAHPLNDAPLGH